MNVRYRLGNFHLMQKMFCREFSHLQYLSDLLFDEPQIQNIIKDSNSRIVTVNKKFFVLEKSGRRHEVDMLYRELSAFGIMQFVRSGRIAVTKEEMNISKLLAEFQH